jgi:hypothetical protein
LWLLKSKNESKEDKLLLTDNSRLPSDEKGNCVVQHTQYTLSNTLSSERQLPSFSFTPPNLITRSSFNSPCLPSRNLYDLVVTIILPSMDQCTPPARHQRVSYSSTSPPSIAPPQSLPQLGTIRYEGPVPPTKGVWYGIEWDDASRGKHSGVYEKTGERFFQTRCVSSTIVPPQHLDLTSLISYSVEDAGSFLRPNAGGLDTKGKTFKQALYSKYLDVDLLSNPAPSSSLPAGNVDETDGLRSELYSTESNFEIEVVSSNKVNHRFKQLGRLREVGLEWENLSRAIDEGAEQELEDLGIELSRSFTFLPSIRLPTFTDHLLAGLEVLNLSYSLLPTLCEAERIAAVLPRLQQLALKSVLFHSPSIPR